MKLLFIDFTLPQLLRDAEFPAGGWAVQLRQLLIALSEAGHRVGVLTWKGANDFVGQQSICDLVETYDPTRGIRKVRFFSYRLPALFSAARAYRPDVIIQSCSAMETGIMVLIAGELGVPFVHRIASDIDTDGRYVQYLDFRNRTGFRYGLKRARLVICQNAYQLNRIRTQFPGKSASILHNCIQIPASSGGLRLRSERTYVAWVGNFSPPKNIPLLYEIARQHRDIEFRIAGILVSSGANPTILAALDGLKRLHNVRFAGYLTRSAVFDFLGNAVALLCTSDFEGFSNTFLEAFASGTPVVLRTNVDPDNIVANRGLGLVARDTKELADRVRELVSLDAASHDRLASKCRQYVEAHHTPAAAAARLISMLKDIA